jgi:hypothetical protein
MGNCCLADIKNGFYVEVFGNVVKELFWQTQNLYVEFLALWITTDNHGSINSNLTVQGPL